MMEEHHFDRRVTKVLMVGHFQISITVSHAMLTVTLTVNRNDS
jgi:hypothetical protein